MHNFDIVATIGSYEKDGQKKYVTRQVGKVVVTKDGHTKIKLDASFNPAGCVKGEDGMVWLSTFEPKTKDASKPAASNGVPFDDSIPF